MLERLYNHFRRKTNSTNFIPSIDGLRFLAILWVVLGHINGFVADKAPVVNRQSAGYRYISDFLTGYANGTKGVLIFFAISGFILALPFAKSFWQGGQRVNLKKYFLRRLTRLEPPYIINIIACAVLVFWFGNHGFGSMVSHHSFASMLPGLGASLLYLHSIIFPRAISVNPVAWSLEIEVQFYCLVPLLVLVLKLGKFKRRGVLAGAVILFVLLQHLVPLPVRTLYSFIQYFLLGFLLVDAYMSGLKLNLNRWASAGLGLLALAAVICFDPSRGIFQEYAFVVAVFVFFFQTLTDGIWHKIFSWRLLTAIGGMCYSIYLWHDIIMSAVGNRSITLFHSASYPLTFLAQLVILLPAILVGSSVFYLLIERPCMDKDWPKKLWYWVSGKKKSAPAVSAS